jgi:CDP-diacylglycerol--serine O-phosphatidyltransferase
VSPSALRYLPPNAVTLLSLSCGLASILYGVEGFSETAAWLILYSVLLDGLDGPLARVLKAQSKIGGELDSFADFVSFGLAPAFLLAGVGDTSGPLSGARMLHLLGLVYVFGCVLRLARYNVMDGKAFPGMFRGIPSTFAGGIVASSVLVAVRHSVDLETRAMLLAGLLAVLGMLMVSPLYIPRVGTARTTFWKRATVVNMAIVWILILTRTLPEYLLACGVAYFAAGSVIGARRIAELRKSPAVS